MAWREVWRTADHLEAEIVKALLESAGVPLQLRGESLGPLYGLTRGSLAEVRVLVPEEDAERARSLLLEHPPI